MAPGQRVAIVTGAGGGIGRAIASQLATDGYRVVVADIDRVAAAATVADLGGDALAFQVDVTDPASVEAMVQGAVTAGGRIDALVSNAGIGGTYPFLDYPLAHWHKVMAINLTGVFLCGQMVARQMVQQRQGRIVNLASISGIRAGVGRTAYGTSKGGVIALTQQMAVELAPYGITVNAVAPGPVDTPMTRAMHTPGTRRAFNAMIPLGRYGSPAEIAGAVAFLCSDAASYVNGHVLAVDGGLVTAGMLAEDVT